MLKFQSIDPFPLLESGACSYLESQLHAEAADAWLGLRVVPIEAALVENGCRARAPGASGEHQQLWLGLDTRSLLTPYIEIRNLLAKLAPQPGQTIVDLGAGYGRMGFVIGRHYPEVRFVGYEYVGERVRESKRCLDRFRHPLVSMEHADLTVPGFSPVAADIYFIYDYGSPKAIEKTLHDLRRVAQQRPVVIVGRGRHCRMAIESRHHWLSRTNPNEPEGRATVYVSDSTNWRRNGFVPDRTTDAS